MLTPKSQFNAVIKVLLVFLVVVLGIMWNVHYYVFKQFNI